MKAFIEYKLNDYTSCEVIEEPKLQFGYHGHSWTPIKIKTDSYAEFFNAKPKAFMITLMEDDGVVIKQYHVSDVTQYKLNDQNLEISIKFEYLVINY